MDKKIINASDEAWENRTLGSDEAFVAAADDIPNIDSLTGTQLISIRLQRSLIEDFKVIASLNGNIGYQTLMKQILQRFADSEKKRIYNDLVADKLKKLQTDNEVASSPKVRVRKTA